MLAIDALEPKTAESQTLGAESDEEAIRLFLSHRNYSDNTKTSYMRELFRFFIWSRKAANKTFKELSGKDFITYSHFLKNIPEDWCNPVRRPHSKKTWRPFTGSLSPTSHKHALTCVRSFFRWLAAARYLSCDPSLCVSIPNVDQRLVKERIKSRCLSKEQLQTVMHLLSVQDTFEADRTRFILSLMYFLGLRIHEVVKHCMNDFRYEDDIWWFHCIGKGNKYRKIAVNDDMLQELARYRIRTGMPRYPTYNDKMPLAYSALKKKAMTDRRLSQIVKAAMEESAELLDGEDAEKLRMATAHWFRHTGITAQINAGVPYDEVTEQAGHNNFNTTLLYIHKEDKNRNVSMQLVGSVW